MLKNPTAMFRGDAAFWARAVLWTGSGLLLLMLWVNISGRHVETFGHYSYTGSLVPATPFTPKTRISQEFTAASDHLNAVFILMATYQTQPVGHIKFRLTDVATGRIVADCPVYMTQPDNAYVCFRIPSVGDTRNRRYRLELQGTPDCRPGNTMTVYMNRSQNLPPAVLDGTAGTTSLQMYARYGGTFSWWYLPLAALATLLAAVLTRQLGRFYHPESNWQHAFATLGLFVAGAAVLIWRNYDLLALPQLYSEDGPWTSAIMNTGLWPTLLHARVDYFVWGNVLLLFAAIELNELLFGCNLAFYPTVIFALQLSFYITCALLPFLLMRRVLPLFWRLLGFALIIGYPVISEGGYEIFGKISNVGYLFYYISFCLLFYWFTEAPGWGCRRRIIVGALILLLLLLCCGTNPATYLAVFLFACVILISHAAWSGEGWTLSLSLRALLTDVRFSFVLFCGICVLGVLGWQKYLLNGDITAYTITRPIISELVWETFTRPFFFCSATFYTNLTQTTSIVLLTSFALLITLVLWGNDNGKRRYLFIILSGTLFFLVITMLYRPMFDKVWQYRNAFPMRYFYGTAFMLILLLLFTLSTLAESGKRWKIALAFLLSGYLLGNCFLWRNAFFAVNFYPSEGTFAEQIQKATKTDNPNFYAVKIVPSLWAPISLQSKYIEATRAYLRDKK